jgi:hypothetical protein
MRSVVSVPANYATAAAQNARRLPTNLDVERPRPESCNGAGEASDIHAAKDPGRNPIPPAVPRRAAFSRAELSDAQESCRDGS